MTHWLEMNRALELDPLSLIIQSGIGRILHFAGRLDEALEQYRRICCRRIPGLRRPGSIWR